jgi:magnesium-transporting ATPase (P-type)
VVRIVAVVAVTTGAGLAVGGLVLGLGTTEAFLFGVGVTVALVPEGLLPTVTLSLARGAQVMAERNALVRRLDAVETLGATTFICTDKTGTLTQNRMQVVRVVTPAGRIEITGRGYEPTATLSGSRTAIRLVPQVARAAAACVDGRVVRHQDWVAEGDPMEAALDCLAKRCGEPDAAAKASARRPYSPDTMTSAAVLDGEVAVLGAPEAVLQRCVDVPTGIAEELELLTGEGARVIAVAGRALEDTDGSPENPSALALGAGTTSGLTLLGLLALEDPPRDGVAAALETCRQADIRVAMLTGDHPRTARAIALEIGLLRPGGTVLVGGELPDEDDALAALLDRPEGAVVARVSPADKFRIQRALRGRGHVVAMTGDGVNDAPALREADVGVAMGARGSDVAREAADLVLLDDDFRTIVAAIELGRATFDNIRRFLTYHLTDNVAELAPFALWALTGGRVPLAIGVLQVLALDIGTDMLPALALGGEPTDSKVLQGRRASSVVDRTLLFRAFGILGATEAAASMVAFTVVLLDRGWTWGASPEPEVLALASGTTFAAIALSQMANAFACRSTTRPVWRLRLLGNRLVVWAVLAEAVLLTVFLGVPGISHLLGGAWPDRLGWAFAISAAVALILVDGLAKSRRTHRR